MRRSQTSEALCLAFLGAVAQHIAAQTGPPPPAIATPPYPISLQSPPPGPSSLGATSAIGPSGAVYSTVCDAAFSEPGACAFTPLSTYPNSTSWFDGVTVPAQLENTNRPYENLFPADHYQGSIGTQCGGTHNCAQNMISSTDCLPSPQNGLAGTSWWGLDLPWPNARCGNNLQEYTDSAMWCQRSSSAQWFCAANRPAFPSPPSPPAPPPSPPAPPPSPPNPPHPPQPPPGPYVMSSSSSCPTPQSWSGAYNPNYTCECDPTCSEPAYVANGRPGACDFTCSTLSTYPVTSYWYNSVVVPSNWAGKPRPYRDFYLKCSYIGGVGTQCGGRTNCANGLSGDDCTPDPQNAKHGVSWWAQDLAWPNIRCGNSYQDYVTNQMWCQRVNADVWTCAKNAPAPVPVVPVPERPAFMDALAAEITLPADAETYVPLLPPVPPAPPPTTPTLLPGLFVQSYTYVPIQSSGTDPSDPGAGTLTVVSPLPLENATASQQLEAITLTGNFSVGSINYDGTVAPTSFGPYTALRFSGFFYAPYTAQYDFHAHGADGAIVWMDDQRTPFIAGNQVGSGGQIHQPAYLTGGLHHIVGEYFYEPLQDPNPPILVLTITAPSSADFSTSFFYDPRGPCNADCVTCGPLGDCQVCAHGALPVGGVCPSALAPSTPEAPAPSTAPELSTGP